mmetsp:Transcript_364/g.531  ORF Transcript_364/g.531 Transcript_364/m.531 type:complete len:192 (+) Transcript_364:120-695(+)
MATNDLHFTVSTNGVEDTTNYHDSPAAPGGIPPANQQDWGRLSQSAHPFVIIFHLLFKSLALLMYLFGGWFSKAKNGGSAGANFIVVTVICIFLLSADFWTVKNVTGRLLVGLRWWNKVENDQTSWIFESAKKSTSECFRQECILDSFVCRTGGLGSLGVLCYPQISIFMADNLRNRACPVGCQCLRLLQM